MLHQINIDIDIYVFDPPVISKQLSFEPVIIKYCRTLLSKLGCEKKRHSLKFFPSDAAFDNHIDIVLF